MLRKMIFTYTLPVLAVTVAVTLVGGTYLSNRYEEQFRYSIEQMQGQTGEYLSSTLNAMRYITNTMSVDDGLLSILSDEQFGVRPSITQTYQEYYALMDCFHRFEIANPDFHTGIFLPDDIVYSNNEYYFYPRSEMTGLDNYLDIRDRLARDEFVYVTMIETRTANLSIPTPYLTLLHHIQVTSEGGHSKDYVTRVGIRTEELSRILRNARPTESSAVFLLNGQGELIASAGTAEDLPAALTAGQDSRLRNWSSVRYDRTTVYYPVRTVLRGSDWSIISLIPETEYRQLWIGGIAGLIILTVGILSYYLSRYYVRRITTLNDRMKEVGAGEVNALFPRGSAEEAADSAAVSPGQVDEMATLYHNFDYMMEEIQKLMKEQYRLGKHISRAEMRALQAQINPHFLYNTLDLINWGAQDYGADRVAEIARSLGQFYRLSLNHGKPVISIEEELQHVQAFVRIENAHYEDAISLTIDVPEEIRSFACLNITLQPFVENSILHGIGEHPEITSCSIIISARREDDDIIFTVSDDGPGIDPAIAQAIELSSRQDRTRGYGIGNIQFRIRLAYGEQYGIHYLIPEPPAAAPSEDAGSDPAPLRRGTSAQIRIRALTTEELSALLE